MIFFFMNIIASFHAWKFTHFATSSVIKTKSPTKLSVSEKLKALAFGVSNPRPENSLLPSRPYNVIKLKSSKIIECWDIKIDSAKGYVILFHGYSANKSLMLDKAEEFLKLRYNVFLVDFIGSGGSEGNQTTVGFKEAEDVNAAYNYISQKGEKNLILFGSSMGAAAIMKAINQFELKPSSVILECPFGSMYQTTAARFKNMGVPAFPMAGLLVFWGGAENGFWAFGHNPVNYARSINCPVLLVYGEKDKQVSKSETIEIFENLKGKKVLKIYPEAEHENYLIKYHTEWINDVSGFLTQNKL